MGWKLDDRGDFEILEYSVQYGPDSWSFSLGDSLAGGEDVGGISGVVALMGILGAFCGRDESHKMHKPFGLDEGGSMMSSITHMRSVQSSSVSTMRFSS